MNRAASSATLSIERHADLPKYLSRSAAICLAAFANALIWIALLHLAGFLFGASLGAGWTGGAFGAISLLTLAALSFCAHASTAEIREH